MQQVHCQATLLKGNADQGHHKTQKDNNWQAPFEPGDEIQSMALTTTVIDFNSMA